VFCGSFSDQVKIKSSYSLRCIPLVSQVVVGVEAPIDLTIVIVRAAAPSVVGVEVPSRS